MATHKVNSSLAVLMISVLMCLDASSQPRAQQAQATQQAQSTQKAQPTQKAQQPQPQPQQSTPRGEAVVVLKHAHGGILELKGDHALAEQDQRKKILDHCKGPYRIISQGIVAVGIDPTATSKSKALKKYRVSYKCATTESPVPRQ